MQFPPQKRQRKKEKKKMKDKKMRSLKQQPGAMNGWQMLIK
jgi:hypothetical protein